MGGIIYCMKTSNMFKAAWEALQIPNKPHRKQIKAIGSILDGQDALVVAPTSFGKSAIYLVPAIVNSSKVWTLVIEPTLALIVDQVNWIQKQGIAADMLTSRNREDHDSILDRLSK